MVTMKLLVLVMCLIGLCSSIPVSEEHDREERSASDEMFRGNGRGLGGFYRYQPPQYPSYFPYAQPPQSNSALMALLPFLLARLAATPAATPAAAPAPAPAPAAATPAPAAGGK
ncbi:histone acetyltransferase KAT2A-like [Salmo salar]|uniref:Histone acetyltransferase KAT2A-like n=1 Tax=Salmo salar TaxID=8030 RepID=A0A1S3RFP3_SALSA|nr:histone acetyltransferase KAT2A-like [Salmo salar]|eukprot:XP_014051123.1 PREDICTED: histone acetyltransferase KAT2A-like [Salmo salar]